MTGPDEIVIQGDVLDDLLDFIPEKWPEVIIHLFNLSNNNNNYYYYYHYSKALPYLLPSYNVANFQGFQWKPATSEFHHLLSIKL